MGAFESLGEHLEELLAGIMSAKIGGGETFYATQYTFWLVICSILFVVVVIQGCRHVKVVPEKNRLSNGFEMVFCMVKDGMCEGIIGPTFKKHVGFVATVFFFILVNNIIGLIPGCKPGTGTFGVTVALALVVFIYFNYYGMKKQGVGHYILNLAPKGVVLPLACLVWLIELVSLILRLFTLAVRLFANMFAGHIVLGVFATLTTLFIQYAIASVSVVSGLPALAWMVLLILMYAMELLVACIQAYVFALLTAVYISLAVNPSH